MLKKYLCLTFGLFLSQNLHAALLAEDAITNNAPGERLGTAAPWDGSSAQVMVAAGNLTHATLQALSPAGNMANILGTSGGSSYRPFTGTAVTSGNVYYSFLVQCVSLPTDSGYLTGFLPDSTTSPGGSSDPLAVYFTPNGSGFQLGIRKTGASAVYASSVLSTNTTYLVVAKYAFGAGTGDDVVSLFLSPTPGAVEPTPDQTQTGGTDAANLLNIYLKSSSGYNSWNIDTLRVGTTWADVTPTNGAPVPSDQPQITETLLTAEGLVLRGTNGSSGGVYQVLSSTNLELPLAQWDSIATNTFDVDGNFDSTNVFSPAEPYRFYRLLLGGEIPPPPTAPSITVQPASQGALVGQDAIFSVVADGTVPLAYQWYFNTNTPLLEATNERLTITNVQTSDAGAYHVVVANDYGAATSSIVTLTVLTNLPLSAYNLYGFAQATTGGGVITETDPGYRKVTNELDFITALADKTDTIKVIEILNDLDLGWNEVGTNVQAFSIFREHTTPLLHPRLLETGVSLIDVQSKNGLTIFSANGATIRHGTLNIKNCANIIVRNLKFDEMWEWDEATKGDYDRNDWDFIDIGNGGGVVSNVWIDHCTFTKAYDGICDIKGGAFNITFSWNKYAGDDGVINPDSFVRHQINSLESNSIAYPMYHFLRTHGFSVEDIVSILQGHDKTHLVGATSFDPENSRFAITFHHQWYQNPWDRLPRLRGGNVHNYNIYVDDTEGLAARRLRDARADAMSSGDRDTLNNTYNFQVFLNGSISTEGGALLVEKSVYTDCLWPLRNNQTDPSNPSYTGKILALDTIYRMDDTNGVPTIVRGDSTDPGNPLGPFQATIIPFSWNLPGYQLPYSYVLDDPSQVEAIVTDPNTGAGAGVLTWAKTNWLETSY